MPALDYFKQGLIDLLLMDSNRKFDLQPPNNIVFGHHHFNQVCRLKSAAFLRAKHAKMASEASSCPPGLAGEAG